MDTSRVVWALCVAQVDPALDTRVAFKTSVKLLKDSLLAVTANNFTLKDMNIRMNL